MSTFTEQNKIVNAYPAKDVDTATVATDIISMKGYDHATFIITFGVVNTEAVTSTNLIAYKGENVTTCDTAFACKYRAELTSAGDTLGALTTLSVDGITVGKAGDEDIQTGTNFLVVEIDAADLAPTVANPYDTVRLGMIWSNHSILMNIVCILSNARWKDADQPTAITD